MLSEQFILFQQEGFLVNSMLRSGLTALVNSSLEEKGNFYKAFFDLSIGIERTMKLIIILDFMINNELKLPSSGEIKAWGHNILKLNDVCTTLGQSISVNSNDYSDDQSKDLIILSFLSEFALKSRYYNFDTLTKRNGEVLDPLTTWGEIVSLISGEISQARLEKAKQQADVMGALMADFTHIVSHDFKKKQMTIDQALWMNSLIGLVHPRINLRLVKILRFYAEIISKQVRIVHKITHDKKNPPTLPYMNEFFYFLNYENSAILKKKKWI